MAMQRKPDDEHTVLIWKELNKLIIMYQYWQKQAGNKIQTQAKKSVTINKLLP